MNSCWDFTVPLKIGIVVIVIASRLTANRLFALREKIIKKYQIHGTQEALNINGRFLISPSQPSSQTRNFDDDFWFPTCLISTMDSSCTAHCHIYQFYRTVCAAFSEIDSFFTDDRRQSPSLNFQQKFPFLFVKWNNWKIPLLMNFCRQGNKHQRFSTSPVEWQEITRSNKYHIQKKSFNSTRQNWNERKANCVNGNRRWAHWDNFSHHSGVWNFFRRLRRGKINQNWHWISIIQSIHGSITNHRMREEMSNDSWIFCPKFSHYSTRLCYMLDKFGWMLN